MYIDALMFMLMQCTYMTGKHLIFRPLLSLSFFVSSWPESWDSDFSVDRENCQGVMLFVSLCHQARWWRPGRVETAAAEWGRARIRSARPPCALYRLFGLRGLPPHSSSAFNISCAWAGRCWACASSWSCWSPVDFIQTVPTQAKQTCPNRRRLPKGGTCRRPLISIRITLPLPELELSVAISASWVHALRVHPNSSQTQHANFLIMLSLSYVL